MTEKLLTVNDLAELVGFRPFTIRKWARLGVIPGAIRRGNEWRFTAKSKAYFKLN